METPKQEAVLTVWSNGTYMVWGDMDAEYVKGDPEYLTTIPIRDIIDGLVGPARLSPIKVLGVSNSQIDLIRIDEESPDWPDDRRPVAFSVRNIQVAERMAYAWNLLFGKEQAPTRVEGDTWSS